MARYLVGEVDNVLYWHEVDEEATETLRREDLAGSYLAGQMCKTTHGLVFGSYPLSSIPEDTPFAVYEPEE